MLLAAPEFGCGAVVDVLMPASVEAGLPFASRRDRWTEPSTTLKAGEAAVPTSVCSETCSDEGVSSMEVAKWDAMPVAFSVEDAIH